MRTAASAIVPPPGEPSADPRSDTSNASDAWRALPLEGAFQFSYRDAAGRPSRRQLIARELKLGPGKMLLGGIDLSTGAYRGFRVDRIHFLEDAGSGEVVGRNVLDWLMKTACEQDRVRRRALAAARRMGNVRTAAPRARL